jgi:gliding motility-associated-like protein
VRQNLLSKYVSGQCFLFSLLLLVALLRIQESKAQGLCDAGSQRGEFTVAPTSGCAPLTVTVRNTKAGASNINWDYNYQGQTSPTYTQSLTNTYTKAGTYTILQAGSASGTGFTACKTVKVLDTTQPNVKVTACADGKVKLTVVDDSIFQQYDQIEVQWNDGSGVNYVNKGEPLELEHTYSGTGQRQIRVRGVYFSGSCNGGKSNDYIVTLNNIQLDKVVVSRVESRADSNVIVSYAGVQGAESEVLIKSGGGNYGGTGIKSKVGGNHQITLPKPDPNVVHCLRIKTSDVCGNSKESNEVCTTVLRGTPENERNVLGWSEYPMATGFVEYRVLRNNVVVKTITGVKNISYIDTDVECGVTYRYQVIAETKTIMSVSAPVEVTAISTRKPGTITQALVSVEQDGSVSLLAVPPVLGQTTSFKMFIERAESGSNDFKEIGVMTNNNRYTDKTAQTSARSYCYRISYENACGNRSDPSEAICTVWLQRNGTAIRWTTDEPFIDNVGSYFVIKLNTNGGSSETPVGFNTTYDPRADDPNEQEFSYQVRVRSRNGNFLSYSNVINFRREAALFLPDAFSPNGDGQNDVFQVKGVYFDSFLMLIYNRWGEVVHRSTDAAQGWDGTINGVRAPEGNYIYRVEIKDNTSRPFVKTGTLLLMR